MKRNNTFPALSGRLGQLHILHLLVGTSGARLMVKQEDAQKAEELLEDFNGDKA